MAISTASGLIFNAGLVKSSSAITASTNHPFRIFTYNDLATSQLYASLSQYSALLKSFSVTDTVPILGLTLGRSLDYGEKIFLEIFYGKSGDPVLARIQTGRTWDSKTKNSKGDSVETYPNCIELVTKDDLTDKIEELKLVLTDIESEKTLQIQEINDKKNAGLISGPSATSLVSKIQTDVGTVKKNLTSLLNGFSTFVTGKAKKQFKSFTMIGYTTKDLDSNIVGETAYSINGDDSESDAFKIVQCVNTDLILVDTCFNHTACKIPIPFSSPVYYFEPNSDGVAEDDVNAYPQ